VKGLSGTEGEGGWHGRDGRLWLDCLPCVSLNERIRGP
jgi:benzoate 4-monooxygenase